MSVARKVIVVAAIASVFDGCATSVGVSDYLRRTRAEILADPPLQVLRTSKGNVVLAPESWGSRLLQPCSRSSLGQGGAYWVPTPREVELTQDALTQHFVSAPPPSSLHEWPNLRSTNAQFVGVVRDGARSVYGSYMPKQRRDISWRQLPLSICDGGPAYFGVKVDLASSRVVSLEFDGCMCRSALANDSLERSRD